MSIDPLVKSAVQMGYDDWRANAIVLGCTVLTVGLSVLVHYEGLNFLSRRFRSALKKEKALPHRRVLYGIFCVLGLHMVEICVFGIAYALLYRIISAGFVAGAHSQEFFDYIYFSASVFTTVGFGDLAPVGPMRLMAGMEALTGLVLITWSASFTYFQMGRYRNSDESDD